MIDLSGVFAPVTTPFDARSGDLDVQAMVANALRLAITDIAGLVLFGTTGEGLLVDGEERVAALEKVRKAVPDKRVLAAAGAESTRGAVRLARDAAAAGADAVLVAPPAYYRPQMTPEALREHYFAVAEASPIPLLVYQIPPAYSGIELRSGLVAELARHGNIVGIKDSRGDLRMLAELIEMCPRDFQVLVGSGAAFYGGLEVGAAGGILAVADLAPEWCCEVLNAWKRGDGGAAGAAQERLTVLHKKIVGEFGVPGMKAALDLLGQAGGPPRAPLRSLGERQRTGVREVLEEAGLSAALVGSL